MEGGGFSYDARYSELGAGGSFLARVLFEIFDGSKGSRRRSGRGHPRTLADGPVRRVGPAAPAARPGLLRFWHGGEAALSRVGARMLLEDRLALAL
jgi:hypothetical protein